MNNIVNDHFIVLCNYNNEFEIINQELLWLMHQIN